MLKNEIMLLLLLLQLIRKLRSKGFDFNLIRILKQLLFKIKYAFPFLLLSMSYSDSNTINEERIAFEIMNKDKSVGHIIVEKIINKDMTTYIIKSKVETRFLLKFTAKGEEQSVYRNDTLIYSSIYRKLNNKLKVNQSIKFNNGTYSTTNGKKKSKLDIGVITCNLVMLFFEEPKNIDMVYCDKLKKKLKVLKMKTGVYKVNFPNKSYTIYYYKKGLISHMDAVGSFYNVRMIKKQQMNYKNEITSL